LLVAQISTSGGRVATDDALVVCLGFPVYGREDYVARMRAVSPRVEPVVLPVDPDAEWAEVNPGQPHDEPPPWARSVAEERRRALARAEVFFSLHTPKALLDLTPRLRWIQGVGAGVE
jgi:predicted 2-oxoglutarate/Fe(II)-dependent dioxygenase YbiX